MPAAIRVVFPDAVHRLCLWHVINKYQPLLNELYALFKEKKFQEKFRSVIYHPLTPVEFETAWQMLVNEFELQAEPTLQLLYEIRAEWVPCYFKDDFCGIMSSTQRSESVNHIVKKCHVDANTPLHLFAKQMMRFIHRRKMAEATETYGYTVCRFMTYYSVQCIFMHLVTITNILLFLVLYAYTFLLSSPLMLHIN